MPNQIIFKRPGSNWVANASNPRRELAKLKAPAELAAEHSELVVGKVLSRGKILGARAGVTRIGDGDRFLAERQAAVPGAEIVGRRHGLFQPKKVPGIGATHSAKKTVLITLDFEISAKSTEEEIVRIVRAIVAQDSERYPGANAAFMSTSPRYFDRRYRVGERSISLSILAYWWKRARGLKYHESRAFSKSSIVQNWKENCNALKASSAFPLTLDFEISKNPTEAEIGRIVKAIVAQDSERYPGASSTHMSASAKYFYRCYRVGEREISLSKLAGWTRLARGLKAGDIKNLLHSAIIQHWQENLFGLKKEVKNNLVIDITLDFDISENPTEEEIGEIVKAIVAQDSECYPGANAALMSTSPRYIDRRYCVGEKGISLNLLAGWTRRARRLKAGDVKALSNSPIIQHWQENLFGLKKEVKNNLVIDITLDFDISENPTEEEIGRIIQAIVAQDSECYPNANAALMSTSQRYFNRRYRVGEKEFVLGTLAGWMMRARSLKVDDTKNLQNSAIVQHWQENLFGLKKVVKENLVFPITLSFAISKNPTEEEIGEIVKAIVAQDFECYPGANAALMSTNSRHLERCYRVGEREISLSKLAGWTRLARKLKAGDTKNLQNSAIIQHWKENVFGLKKSLKESLAFPITLDFEISKNPEEGEIGRIVQAIVAQDSENYPSANVRLMSTAEKYLIRRYQVGEKEVSLQTLLLRTRRARGMKALDSKTLPNSLIIREWKEKLFNINPGIMDDQIFQTWVEQNNLGEILSLFGDDPALLIEALSFLRPESLQGRDVRDIVKAYVGLKVERERGKAKMPGANLWEKRRLYILAMIHTLESGANLDLSDVELEKQTALLIRLSRKAFEANRQKLIDDLKDDAKRYVPENYPALNEAGVSFLQRLHAATAAHFETVHHFELIGMRTQAYGYQKEGAHFLVTHDNAILADEAGLGKTYQAWAAIKKLGLKKVLWVTTAANKEQVKEDALQHAEINADQIRIVISGDPAERKAQMEKQNDALCTITNYETLVAMQKNDPEGYARFTEGYDLVVVDEGQFIDNPKALRSKAVQSIQTKRKWLLTATPYQNKPDSIWALLNYLDPERYPDRKAFKQMYTTTTAGLILLHHELSRYMLRRTKEETTTYFQPEKDGVSFAEQLADGMPRVPSKRRIPPEVSGRYELLPEQADLIAWMTADFSGWAKHFNENLPVGAEPIDMETINPLLKFEMIHRVIYEPEYFNILGENPIYKTLDQIVARRMANGEKVILWCWNTKVMNKLQERYEKLGVARIDGMVLGTARENARHQFQEDPKTRVLLANYISGGVGLTLTAAHAGIFVQLPQMFPLFYQVEGRNQRLIGLKNLRHAKDHVESEMLVATLPQGFVEGLTDHTLRETLSHGTLVEQGWARLEGGELLYNFTMAGYGSIEDLEQYFKAGILTGLGLTREEKLDYTSHLSGEAKDYALIVQAMIPLWRLVQDDAAAQEKILQLIEALRHNLPLAQKISTAFQSSGRVASEDLSFILSLFDIRNKYIRQQILNHVPTLIVQVYKEGRSLADIAKELQVDRLSPIAFVAQIYLRSGAGEKAVVDIVKELSGLRDSPTRRYLEEHFLVGVFGILGNPQVQFLLQTAEPLFTGVHLYQKIQAIYRLGLLIRTRPDLVLTLSQAPAQETWGAFSQQLEYATLQAIGEFAGRTADDVATWLSRDPKRQIRVDHYLALLAGYQEHEEETLLNQYQEVLSHIIDGDLKAWRSGSNSREFGVSIDYLSDQPKFWESFAQDDKTELGEVKIRPEKIHASLVKDYISVLQEWDQVGATVEGDWVSAQVINYRALKRDEERSVSYESYKHELQLLGSLRSNGGVTDEAKTLLPKYGLTVADTLSSKSALQAKIDELRNILAWMELDEGFRRLNKNTSPDWSQLVRLMENKANFYRTRGYDKVAEHLETLRDALAVRKDGESTFKEVSIEDTDDETILSRMGTLHPELTNCFNPNGNPTFNQYVVAALASKNMKLVVVRAQLKKDGPQEIVAVAMMKVKRLADGTPVLFLEKGLYRQGYDFRNEMLAHLMQKGVALERAAGITPIVMDEVRGKPKDVDPEVHGTGTFTGIEYVEPVFGLRRADHVKHRGRIVTLVSEPVKSAGEEKRPEAMTSHLYSIGTSNKPLATYIAELKANGVTVVADVRGSPRSQWFPQYNQKAFAAALNAEGINYVWLGDTLGNPKDDHGDRTLTGFHDHHMQTADYKRGLEALITIVQKASGKVAVTCSEGKEKDCHRKYILADLQSRLSPVTDDVAESKAVQLSLLLN